MWMKKSQIITVPVSPTDWYLFQLLTIRAGSSPRLVIGDYVKACAKQNQLVAVKSVTKSKPQSHKKKSAA